MTNKTSKINLIVLALPLFIVCISCNSGDQSSEADQILLTTTLVQSGSVSGELLLPGELEGYYETGILAKVNGYVRRLAVDIGDHVKAGQLLAELDAPELISQVAAGFSEYEAKEAIFLNTKSKYIRLKQTSKTPGAVSPYDLDFAQTSIIADSLAFMAAKAKYESLKQLTDYLVITAPFDGTITERSIAPGAFVGPSDMSAVPLFKLRNEAILRLHVAVPEIHIAEIKQGNVVEFSVKSFPDKLFSGKITRVAKDVAISTRSELIEIEVRNSDGQLLPGMYAKAVIPIKRPKLSLIVPQGAVITNMERSFIIQVIQRGTKVRWVDVEKGEMMGNRVEVFAKIHAGDTILQVGSDEIKDSSQIKISYPDLAIK